MRRRLIGISLLCSMIAVGASAQEWTGIRQTVDGVTVIHNPGQPTRSPVIIEPPLLWAVGGDAEGDESIFGAVVDVVYDDAGNTYVLDQQLSEVKVFDPNGTYHHSIGREGDGPGEFRLGTGVFLIDEDRVGVLQGMPVRVIVFNRDGTSLTNWLLPGVDGFRFVTRVQYCDNSLLAAQKTTVSNNGNVLVRKQLVRVSVEGKLLSTLWEEERDGDLSNLVLGESPGNSLAVWDVTPDGTVYLSGRYDAYRIDVMNLDGVVHQVVEREYEPRERTSAEIEKIKHQAGRLPPGVAKMNLQVASTDRDIQQIYVRDDGELWVVSSRSVHPSGTVGMGDFEVFDASGRYVHDIRVRVDFDDDRDTWFLLHDRLYIMKSGISAIDNAYATFRSSADASPDDDFAPPELRCYRIDYAEP